MTRFLIALLALASCGSLQAAPLVYFSLEGRPLGSEAPFTSNMAVESGDTVEYRLRARMAQPGTFNELLGAERWGSYVPGKHGLNSLSISLFQDSADPIQVDLNSPVELTPFSGTQAGDGWGQGLDASAGTPSLRIGSAYNDLLSIRPIHGPGVFTAREEEIIFTGLLDVTNIAGDSGQVNAAWGTTSGGGIFHGYHFFVTGPNWTTANGRAPTESGPDPLTHFTPLTLTSASLEAVPEPSTLALFGSALIAMALARRRFGRKA